MSWVRSKDQMNFINADQITNMYISYDGYYIRAIVGFTDKAYKMAWYNSAEECHTALDIVYEALKRGDSVTFPSDESVRARIRLKSDSPNKFASNGKKTVRRGGS